MAALAMLERQDSLSTPPPIPHTTIITEQYAITQIHWYRALYFKNNQLSPTTSTSPGGGAETDESAVTSVLTTGIKTTVDNLHLCLTDLNTSLDILTQLLDQLQATTQPPPTPSSHYRTHTLNVNDNTNKAASPLLSPGSKRVSYNAQLTSPTSKRASYNPLTSPDTKHRPPTLPRDHSLRLPPIQQTPTSTRRQTGLRSSSPQPQQQTPSRVSSATSRTGSQFKSIAFQRTTTLKFHTDNTAAHSLLTALQHKRRWILFVRSLCYSELSIHISCIDDCTTILLQDSDFTPAYKQRSMSYTVLKQYNNAISDLRQYVTVKPNDISSVLRLAHLYTHVGHYVDGLSLYTRIRKLSPANVAALYGCAMLHMQQQQYDDALTLLLQILKLTTWITSVHVRLAEVYEHLNQYDTALTHCQSAMTCIMWKQKVDEGADSQDTTGVVHTGIDETQGVNHIQFIVARLHIHIAQQAYKRFTELCHQQLMKQRETEQLVAAQQARQLQRDHDSDEDSLGDVTEALPLMSSTSKRTTLTDAHKTNLQSLQATPRANKRASMAGSMSVTATPRESYQSVDSRTAAKPAAETQLVNSDVPLTAAGRLALSIETANADNACTLKYIHKQLLYALHALVQCGQHDSGNADVQCLTAYVLLFLYGNRHQTNADDMVHHHLRHALRQNDKHINALFLDAVLAQRRKESIAAVEQLMMVLNQNASHVCSLQLLANLQYAQHDLPAARESLNRAVLACDNVYTSNSVKALSYANRGLVRLLQQDITGALGDLEYSLSLNAPHSTVLARLHRAECFKQLGLIDKAIVDYRAVIPLLRQRTDDAGIELKQHQVIVKMASPKQVIQHHARRYSTMSDFTQPDQAKAVEVKPPPPLVMPMIVTPQDVMMYGQAKHGMVQSLYSDMPPNVHGPEHLHVATIPDAYKYVCAEGVTGPDMECIQNSLGILLHQQATMQRGDKQSTSTDNHSQMQTTDDMLQSLQLSEEVLSCFSDAAQHFQARYNRGLVYLQKGELAIALTEFKAAVDAEPTFADARNNYGVVLERSQHVDEAVIHYTEALRLQPMHTIAPFNLANIQLSNGQYSEAIELYSQLLKRHEQMGQLVSKQHKRITLQSTELASRESTDGVTTYKGSELVPLAWNNKAICYTRIMEYQAALECYNHAIQANPALIFVYYNRAHLQILLGNAYNALTDMTKVQHLLISQLQPAHARRTSLSTGGHTHDTEYIQKFIEYAKRYQWALAVAVRDMVQAVAVLPHVCTYDLTVPTYEHTLFNPFVLDDINSGDYRLLQSMLTELKPTDTAFVSLIRTSLQHQANLRYIEAHHSLLEATYMVPSHSIEQRVLWQEIICIWRARIHVYLDQYDNAVNDIEIFVGQLLTSKYRQRHVDGTAVNPVKQYRDARLLHFSGCLYQMTYCYDDALTAYTAAIDRHPEYLYAHMNRAIVHQCIGKYTDALHDISAVVRLLQRTNDFSAEQSKIVDVMQQCMTSLSNKQHTNWAALHELQISLLDSIHVVKQAAQSSDMQELNSAQQRAMSARSKLTMAMRTAEQLTHADMDTAGVQTAVDVLTANTVRSATPTAAQ